MRMTHVRLLVSNFDECFRFYRDVIGFKVIWGAEGESYADFDTGGSALALFEQSAMSSAVGTTHLPENTDIQDRVALIFGVTDVDAAASDLKSKGVQLITEPQDRPDWGIRAAHFRDPAGNLIEIFASLPQEEWDESLREESTKYQ